MTQSLALPSLWLARFISHFRIFVNTTDTKCKRTIYSVQKSDRSVFHWRPYILKSNNKYIYVCNNNYRLCYKSVKKTLQSSQPLSCFRCLLLNTCFTNVHDCAQFCSINPVPFHRLKHHWMCLITGFFTCHKQQPRCHYMEQIMVTISLSSIFLFSYSCSNNCLCLLFKYSSTQIKKINMMNVVFF